MKYKILFPIAYGGRIEKGSVVELPDEIAKAYGPEYVQPVDGTIDTDVNEEDEVALEDMTLIGLKNKAKALGLSTNGGKADLIERISLHTADTSDTKTDDDASTDKDEDESTDDDAE